MKRLFYCFGVILIVCISCAVSFAQPTKLRGRITDAKTQKPIPFVSVVFKGTMVGASTDFDGNYFLETRAEVDSVEVSSLGYKTEFFAVKKHGFKTLNIALKEDVALLDEVVVVFDKKNNPAHRIVRGIIANKKKNNPQKANSYLYDSYTKLEMSLTNINEKFKKKKLLKNFKFIFDYVDTSAVTGKAYLPFLISETNSEVYHSINPKMTKEIIKANQISGFDGDNESITQFTGQLFQKFNIYDNYIRLFKQGFVSPLNSNALVFYKYYLTDSIQRGNKKLYQLFFSPKNPKDATFKGNLWVTDKEFAVTEITMRVTNKVNVNWVNDVMISQEFAQMGKDSTWFWKTRKLAVDFTLFKDDKAKQRGFLGKSTIHYANVKFDEPIPKRFDKMTGNLLVDKKALQKEADYWEKTRPYKLSKTEKGVYAMVDSIKNVPIYRTFVDIITTAITGYYKVGKVEIGPYFKLFSRNSIEGARFQLGGRTNSDFSKKVRFSGHLAYGLKDKSWKYGAGVLYKLSKKNDLWESLGVDYSHDMEQLGKGSSPFLTAGNILATALARGDTDKITLEDKVEIHYEKEWFQNFSNKLILRYRSLQPSDYVPFRSNNSLDLAQKNIHTKEIELNTRFAPGQRLMRRTFSKKTIKKRVPIFNVRFTAGFGDYEYQKIDATVEQTIPIYPIGHTYYYAKAGKIFGKVPFPLLHLHEGNGTYVYDPYAYNLMNYYEFASDTYASLSAEHHFMGFFLNKIPLLKKLNWRTVVSGKALWGKLRDENRGYGDNPQALVLFPNGLSELNKPYFEAGVGIENIFKMIRVEAVWRLSHLKENQEKFGIRATLQLTF